MSTSTALALVQGGFTDFGVAVLAVLGSLLTIAIGYLVFKFGWRKIRGSVR